MLGVHNNTNINPYSTNFETVVEEKINSIKNVGIQILTTPPFHLVKNPTFQVFGGLLALGYGIYQIKSGDFLLRVGLSLGGIILYNVHKARTKYTL